MSQPVSVFAGEVMHRRLFPVEYRFSYRVFSVAIDLMQLDHLGRQNPLLSLNRFNLLSFYTRDHGAGDSKGLIAWANETLRQAGLQEVPAKITLFCFPRVLGYTFNPMSHWYCENDDGQLIAIILEVRNTFGERHPYVVHDKGRPLPQAVRFQREKVFHVSPFIGMDACYHFTLRKAGTRQFTAINEYSDGKLMLVATQNTKAIPLTTGRLLKLMARMPFMTLKVMVMIHWHALKIWLRGATFYTHPGETKS
ncbi:DUF1365 domain-containing protein [Kistimonas scapharcae]|uniref:DUF1365 domain-containing protein n=1 Tax=Kistimonas scapharcae TaxID=1036133 RepID=A0ABP8UW04_9GAMM